MVADRIFRHITPDRLEFEMNVEKWNYLITMTARIQSVISSAVIIKQLDFNPIELHTSKNQEQTP